MSASSARLMPMECGAWVMPVSRSMRAIEAIITEIAGTNIPVLLIGESGTGKEVLARRIHSLSHQAIKPLAKIICTTVGADQFTSQMTELVRAEDDHQDQDRGSRASGTVLFDEIGDLDLASQAVLLHALPDGESIPVTGSISARVIASTTRDLEHQMRAGRFRNDLYYRLNGVSLRLPPLRERREDIPALAEFLLAKHASQLGRPQTALRPESLRALMDHTWPGNIRELENVLRRIVALGDERMAISELESAPAARTPEPAVTRNYSLKTAARAASRETERELILAALARTRWNRKRAARELQISYKSLLYKLKQIGIEESPTN